MAPAWEAIGAAAAETASLSSTFASAAGAGVPASFCRAASASAMKPMNAVSRSSVSRSAISRAGVSQASTVPACIREMRSQRRASFMKWVETKIVTP